MANIIHRVGINAPIAKVYLALSTIEGLAGWWTRETDGSSKVGEEIHFRFRNDDGSIKGSFKIKVLNLDSNKSVKWQVMEGPADWIGSEISFDLKQEGDYAIVLFHHRKWAEESESMAHCSLKWATFLLSLRDLVEKGQGRPAPDDLKIDNWN